MAIAKVIFKSNPNAAGETWIDASTATATAADITAPKTAMLADGVMTTGTGSGGGGAIKHTATITGTSTSDLVRVVYDGTSYRTVGDTFEYEAGDTLVIDAYGRNGVMFYIDGTAMSSASFPYSYTLPDNDISIFLQYGSTSQVNITSPTLNITANGTYNIKDYVYVKVNIT